MDVIGSEMSSVICVFLRRAPIQFSKIIRHSLGKTSREPGDFCLGRQKNGNIRPHSESGSLPPPKAHWNGNFFEQGVPSTMMVRREFFAGKSGVDQQSIRLEQTIYKQRGEK
jgi:hypothetical protein